MDTIRQILRLYGITSLKDMDYDDRIEVEVDGYLPLCIEKVGEHRVSVAHYTEQNRDLMRDPEIVFEVLDDGNWVAVEYIQDPFVYRRDDNGLDDVTAFALTTWDRNLDRQGFVDAAHRAASDSTGGVKA